MAGECGLGVTGLATMGANLARNVARNGFPVAVHNRTERRTQYAQVTTRSSAVSGPMGVRWISARAAQSGASSWPNGDGR